MTKIYARQGDLVIRKLDAPHTIHLIKSQDVVVAGHDTSPHVVRGVVLSRQEGREFKLRIVEPTVISHQDRHPDVALVPGDYTLTPLRERGNAEDRAVED